MPDNLYDLESIDPNLANWADRLQAVVEAMNSQTDRRFLGVLGEAASAGDVVYIKWSDGKIYKAQATGALDKMPAVGFLAEGGSPGDTVRVVTVGVVEKSGWAWSSLTLLQLDTVTAGNIVTASLPILYGPNLNKQVVALAIAPTKILVSLAPIMKFSYRAANYTVATKPASATQGEHVLITDAGTTGRMAYWSVDGHWRYIKDDSLV